MNYKTLILASFTTVFFLGSASLVNADQYGNPQYGGGGPSVFLSINKVVKNPKTGEFVDNLGINDPKYQPDNTVSFQLTITNTSNQSIESIKIKDFLPDHLTFSAGPGSYDSKTKTLILGLDKLESQESRTYTIQAKADKADKLPSDQGIVCVTNRAQAIRNETKGGREIVESEDSSQLCIENPVLPATTKGGLKVFPQPQTSKTPATGPEALALIPLIGSAFGGLALRLKSKGFMLRKKSAQ